MLDGTFRRGATITTTSTGGWSNNPTSFSYRWLRCDSAGTASRSTVRPGRNYRLRAADVGRTVRAIVTARNADGAGSANTKPSPVIATT